MSRATRIVTVTSLALLITTGCALAQKASPSSKKAAPSNLELAVDVGVAQPLMLADSEQEAYVQIAVTGFAPPRADERTPVNLALVIDRSGSMRGERLQKAKEAALMVVDRLSKRDILSVVVYDSTVEVLVPPTRVSNAEFIRRRIMALTDRGSTALYAGVQRGIAEVRRNFSRQRVNRVILLSDGKANVGPSSAQAIAGLGVFAGKQGIPVTTVGIGLGYNEDLMTELALSSDGNHGFAQNASDLVAIFNNELGDLLSVVAQDVIIEIEFAPGVRPLRGVDRELSIEGRKATLKLNQIYGKQEKGVLVAVAVPAGKAGKQRKIANVDVTYRNMYTKKRSRVSDRVAVSFSKSANAVARRANKKVMAEVAEATANQAHRKAIALRDQGRAREAKQVLRKAATDLRQKNRSLASEKLEDFAAESEEAAAEMDRGDWRRQRKSMKKSIHGKATKQSW